MKHLNVRWKLTLWYAGVLGIVLTAFSGSVYFVLRHQLLARIDQGLNEELSDVLSEIERARNSHELLEWMERRFAFHAGFDFEVVGKDGERFFVNPRLSERSSTFTEAPSGERARFTTLTFVDGESWRVVSMDAVGPDGPLEVRVGRSLASFEHESEELLYTFLVVIPSTLAVTVGAGYLLARRALGPVQVMTHTANRITADRLDERLEVGNPDDELGTLARTLNDMIERLGKSFSEMQRFTADAAHELRTPLAVMRSEAEISLKTDRSPEEYRESLGNLLDEINCLSAMADQLLFLCRHDAGLDPRMDEPVDVNELVSEVVTNMRLVGTGKGVAVASEGSGPASLTGNRRQLARVLYNLLDNAIKYTQSGGAVRVKSLSEKGNWTLIVEDDGIGIPAEHLDRVFDRFYRADEARTVGTEGVGLGLSICRSIVRRAGGEISIESRPGQGTRVIVRLPQTPNAVLSEVGQKRTERRL